MYLLSLQLVLKKKIEAIVDCYLDTAGPPWLQVRFYDVDILYEQNTR